MLGDEVTFPRLRAVARGVGEYLASAQPGGTVLVAHDTRFLGEQLAGEAAAVLAGAGLRVVLSAGPVPTPVAAHAVRRRQAAAGLVLTASHNPPEYQGVKLLTARGAAAPAELTGEVEQRASRWLARRPPRAPAPSSVAIREPYVRELARRLDGQALRAASLHVVYDAMHGSGAGVLDAVLRRCGVAVSVLRGDPDPRFGGAAPEPEAAQLDGLVRALRRGAPLRLGLATDGDADRFAVVDAGGPLDASEALALLVDHLVVTGRVERGVVLSSAVGSLPARVASWYGLRVVRDAVGFKHLARSLERGDVELAGDESGGLALRGFGFDKDGMLAGGLLAELAATLRTPLRRRLALWRRRCGPVAWSRAAVEASPQRFERLAALVCEPPPRLAAAPVRGVDASDGLRLELPDGFVQWRSSGTEPLIRIYAEAASAEAVARRLRAAARQLGAGWRRLGGSR